MHARGNFVLHKIRRGLLQRDLTYNAFQWDNFIKQYKHPSLMNCNVIFANLHSEICCTWHKYTVPEKKRSEYFSHNFDKFRHSFVVFGTNNPDTSMYLNVRKFIPTLQQRYVGMTSCLTSSQMPFTHKDGHLTKLFKRKNMTLQVSC